MEKITNFIIQYSDIVYSIIGILLVAIGYRMQGKNKNFMEELLMKYRTENYQANSPPKGETFSQYKPVYRLNTATNTLENTGEVIDIDEVVRSCVHTCLDQILERFIAPQAAIDTQVQEREAMQADIDMLQEAFVTAEDYKARYDLPAEYSMHEVYAAIADMHKKVSASIEQQRDALKKRMEGGKKDETTPTDTESE